ncbi:ESX secretion-associated protein EspG [Mycolicibacterium sp. CBMA 226]|uniref:ESX secretion-associated protein EspG n=1 Tax=Mycolicibacterium sp. CBMA 226 TaxID=2606611 RepID=UPI0013187966|nr:ESX secretion-associated protein EspG [Mycolicibacterium sp. CBMA 226]QGW61173.1 hypothetical protein ICEMyc226_00141 [Mycolicibacterium sp.]
MTDDVVPLRYGIERWSLSGFEFRCAWESLGLDYLPFPLAYRHLEPQLMSQVEAERRAALARLRGELTPARVSMLEALRFPIFVVQGFGRISDGEEENVYRLWAVIGRTGQCAIATQDPGHQLIFGQDIHITGCASDDFPQVLIDALPQSTPGREARREGRYDDRTPEVVLGDAPITGSVLLSAAVDFSLDYELRDPSHLTLITVADDGAYLVHEGTSDFQIVPATVPNLLEAFDRIKQRQMEVAAKWALTNTGRDYLGLP